ncbi:hypothetical protein E4N62_33405 [Streptomyces sp. MNU76]|uniref:hypothetical protein n=1 Tax=Streptomyces sp. MNU76 TaxID=2560026 RepID=UPI001E5032CD|nr:hypothetical protein [Streptomyces sp. MNU76]MCC9709728.1 hypothetical protein [Streptomyces sp. MNU76]
MPADEVTHGTSVGESRARSGPRHAAPKKPLLTRLNVPAGKAIALAAMPTAVLMGMGFTPTLTLARADDPTKLSLTADEYKDCVEALEAAEEGTDTSASPTPTPSAEASESDDPTDEGKDEDTSAGDDTAADGNSSGDSATDDTTTDDSASSDSGSDDKDGSASDEKSTDDGDKSATDTAGSGEAPSADASETGGGNLLEDIGTAIEDLFTPDDKETETTAPSTSTSLSPSPSPSDDASGSDEDEKDDSGSDAGKDAKDTADNASDKVEDAAKDVTGDAEDTEDATDDATATPSPSPSESTDMEGCPVATDDESGVEKGIPPLPNDPWYLDASSLLLKGADYQGVVKVKTADGSVKEVLKYVISDGTDIGDLHQTVEDKQAGVTYHVQAGKGTTSTIRQGKTVMYTEKISGNLLGLIPVTFDPKHPPPLNIPLIYFTKVKVVQAGQFGGTLTVPGMHQFMTD